MRSKETFLTDTQTSDYTKSSGEIQQQRVEQLEEAVRKLERENGELKQRIVELKTSQFYEISEEKLQGLVKETEKLRGELERTRKELKQSLVERDFLDRFNRNLKTQCETLTKEILQLREANHDLKRPDKHLHSARDELELSKSRHSSNDLQLPRRKEPRKEETAGTPHPHNHNHTTHLKTTLSASRLHDDYFSSRPLKPKPTPHSRV